MSDQQELMKREPVAAPAVQNGQADVAHLLQVTLEKLGDANAPAVVEAVDKLVDLHLKLEDRRAESQFAKALAAFQGEVPTIPKSSKATVLTKKGGKFSYNYAELDEIRKTIQPHLDRHDFAVSWDSEYKENILYVTCVLTHTSGHQKQSTFPALIDKEAVMNDMQKAGAALTYGKRQAMIAVLGLVTGEPDRDGASPADRETIDENQQATIQALVEEAGADKEKFFAWLNVTSYADIRSGDYAQAVRKLEEKRRRATG
jgi:hypothetical protein